MALIDNMLEPSTPQERVEDLEVRLIRARALCDAGGFPVDHDGSLAIAEADIAMAKNIHNISREEEWRIRAALGREMGLAPSQVNGWRAIYMQRAERAQRLLQHRREQSARGKQDACEQVAPLLADLDKARGDLSEQLGGSTK